MWDNVDPKVLNELKVNLIAVYVVDCDNVIVGYINKHPMFHTKTKHMEINFYLICEKILSGALHVEYTP